jgi:hypothetical protein
LDLIRRLVKRQPGVDRTEQLQHPETEPVTEVSADVNWQEITSPLPSVPVVIHFRDRYELIEVGYCSKRRPRRVKRANVEPEVSGEPGAVGKVNRLIKRGYYRSLRHAS